MNNIFSTGTLHQNSWFTLVQALQFRCRYSFIC